MFYYAPASLDPAANILCLTNSIPIPNHKPRQMRNTTGCPPSKVPESQKQIYDRHIRSIITHAPVPVSCHHPCLAYPLCAPPHVVLAAPNIGPQPHSGFLNDHAHRVDTHTHTAPQATTQHVPHATLTRSHMLCRAPNQRRGCLVSSHLILPLPCFASPCTTPCPPIHLPMHNPPSARRRQHHRLDHTYDSHLHLLSGS
jgi:hypothetical protein